MTTIEKILIERDGYTEQEAKEALETARNIMDEALESGDLLTAMDVCEDEFGLEPDYIFNLI